MGKNEQDPQKLKCVTAPIIYITGIRGKWKEKGKNDYLKIIRRNKARKLLKYDEIY